MLYPWYARTLAHEQWGMQGCARRVTRVFTSPRAAGMRTCTPRKEQAGTAAAARGTRRRNQEWRRASRPLNLVHHPNARVASSSPCLIIIYTATAHRQPLATSEATRIHQVWHFPFRPARPVCPPMLHWPAASPRHARGLQAGCSAPSAPRLHHFGATQQAKQKMVGRRSRRMGLHGACVGVAVRWACKRRGGGRGEVEGS